MPTPSSLTSIRNTSSRHNRTAHRAAPQVDQDPFEQAGVGVQGRQVVGQAQGDGAAGRTEVVQRRGTTSSALMSTGVTPSAPACRRLMPSRLATRLSSLSSDSSAVASSSPRSWSSNSTSLLRRLATAAFADDSEVRRSWLTELDVRATLTTGAERDRLWQLAQRLWLGYAAYAKRAEGRQIRIFRLTPQTGSSG
jgi:hypothetical protein